MAHNIPPETETISAAHQGANEDLLQPLKIPESRLLFIYFVDIRRGAAGRTD